MPTGALEFLPLAAPAPQLASDSLAPVWPEPPFGGRNGLGR